MAVMGQIWSSSESYVKKKGVVRERTNYHRESSCRKISKQKEKIRNNWAR